MRVVWDETGKKIYETGVDRGMLYKLKDDGTYNKGVPWNGLNEVTESPSGAEPTSLYADNVKYLNLMSAEEFAASIGAYTYPDEFAECDGSVEVAPGVTIGQQERKKFGFCYRTIIGNDVNKNNHGYKLHLIYNALASPSEKGYGTINKDPDAITFSWDVNTEPVNVTGHKSTACLIVDSTKCDKELMAKLEDILYGTNPTTEGGDDGTEPRLPMPDEVITLMTKA